MVSAEKKSILLTFDVEDWFQVENFKGYIPFSTWDSYPLRVEKNTRKILDILDSFSFRPRATFFVLGWIAKKLPQLVREIDERGHEVASHGTFHQLCTKQSHVEIAHDLQNGKKLLEDILGRTVCGYRAPSFAINNDTLKIIEDTGHTYDSSYNSFAMHGRYGSITLPFNSKKGSAYQISETFFELPISNLNMGQRVFPLGGGGYFRLIPFPFFKAGIKSILNKEDTFLFYSHPWEFDPGQPRVDQAAKAFKFRHYINLDKTELKLTSLIKSFSHCNFISCTDYLETIEE